jgi:hypothetical protein
MRRNKRSKLFDTLATSSSIVNRISFGESNLVDTDADRKQKSRLAQKVAEADKEVRKRSNEPNFFEILDRQHIRTAARTMTHAFSKHEPEKVVEKRRPDAHGTMMIAKLKKAAFYVKAVQHEKKYNQHHATEKLEHSLMVYERQTAKERALIKARTSENEGHSGSNTSKGAANQSSTPTEHILHDGKLKLGDSQHNAGQALFYGTQLVLRSTHGRYMRVIVPPDAKGDDGLSDVAHHFDSGGGWECLADAKTQAEATVFVLRKRAANIHNGISHTESEVHYQDQAFFQMATHKSRMLGVVIDGKTKVEAGEHRDGT